MNTHTITDLRRRLFETIDGVRNNTIDLDKAKTISQLSQVIVDTAKVEVEFLRATDGVQSEFLQPSAEAPEVPGITGRTIHRIS